MKENVKKALTGDFNRKKGLLFLITALLTVLVWNLPIDCFGIEGLTVVQQRIIAIFVMAVMLWLTEAIPAWATSVVIIFVLLFGASNSAFNIMQGSEGEYGELLEYQGIMACFADPTIILFLGGFIMAIAATKSRLDVLMAKTLIAPFGKRSENVLLGFMLITGIFSMFISNTATAARVMDIEAAKATGAMMLFGEKYGETVRVLDIGTSRELCGGTHVQRTGDIGLFKIVAESGVAAGVRRVEAVTGLNALTYLQGLEATVDAAASTLKAPTAELTTRIVSTLEQIKTLEKEVAQLKGKLASSQGDELLGQAVEVQGVKILAAQLEGADAKTLRDTLDKLKDKLKSAAIVLAAVDGDKVQLAAGVTPDTLGKVKAGELVNFVAQQVGGKGGGKPDMAMAGGTQPAALPQALASVQAWVAQRL